MGGALQGSQQDSGEGEGEQQGLWPSKSLRTCVRLCARELIWVLGDGVHGGGAIPAHMGVTGLVWQVTVLA